MAQEIESNGCSIQLDFSLGDTEFDNTVDIPPYTHIIHLKLLFENIVTTSFGIIATKN